MDRSLAETPANRLASPWDPEWRSECELENDGDTVFWRPVIQHPAVNFDGLANAVEAPIHPDICAYFGSFWCGSLEARADDGHVSLIQLWNTEDFDRLIANLIGHLMAKQKQRQPFTVFFATTEPDSELFLSIDNASGKVLLEEPGRPPLRSVADTLPAFIDSLTPVAAPPRIY